MNAPCYFSDKGRWTRGVILGFVGITNTQKQSETAVVIQPTDSNRLIQRRLADISMGETCPTGKPD